MPAADGQIAAFLDVAAETLDTIDRVLDDLDDTTVNAAPPVPGVNTVFALVTHVGGALGYWGGSLMAGEDIPRERSTEFRATGTVAEARAIVARLRTDVPRWAAVAATGIRNPGATGTTRRSSSSSLGRSAPGRVDSPPTSTTLAPAATRDRPWAIAASVSIHRPPSLKESGVTLTMPMTTGPGRSCSAAIRVRTGWVTERLR